MHIKDWKKFQHFKDRKPPWIKLYRDILDDPEWFALHPQSAKMLVMIWLLASENDGYLPDIKKISFRLRITCSEVEQVINDLKHWINIPDINAISVRYQSDTPERERETEKEAYKPETEEETEVGIVPVKPSRPAAPKISDGDWLLQLKTNPAYADIEIDREYGKMLAWCQNKKKVASRARFLNWLNRIDVPMKAVPGLITASKGAMGAMARAAALRKEQEGLYEISAQ